MLIPCGTNNLAHETPKEFIKASVFVKVGKILWAKSSSKKNILSSFLPHDLEKSPQQRQKHEIEVLTKGVLPL